MVLAFAAFLAAQPLAGHSMVYSARDKAVLLIGGDSSGNLPIYRLQGGNWVAIPKSDLPARSLPAVAADNDGNVLVHGGAVGTKKADGGIDFKPTADTYLWNGKWWSKVAMNYPSARDHHAMVYDSNRNRFVLYGGSDADPSGRSVFFGDTWEWDGKKWNQVATSGPGLRCHFSMAYDPVRRRTVMVGGYGPRGADAKTWTWDGRAWSTASQGTPADRHSPRLAWDSQSNLVVLFGGESNGTSPSDTWSWNGSDWKRIASNGPPGRTVHAMAYDTSRNEMIVYGGASGNDVVGDVWTFRGGKWQGG